MGVHCSVFVDNRKQGSKVYIVWIQMKRKTMLCFMSHVVVFWNVSFYLELPMSLCFCLACEWFWVFPVTKRWLHVVVATQSHALVSQIQGPVADMFRACSSSCSHNQAYGATAYLFGPFFSSQQKSDIGRYFSQITRVSMNWNRMYKLIFWLHVQLVGLKKCRAFLSV